MAFVEWTLSSDAEKRFRKGHPWVFSSDLDHSPGAIEPGQWVRLRGRNGEFLAWGYGHPRSLIAFRVLSRDPQFEVWKPEKLIAGLEAKLRRAFQLRLSAGLSTQQSFRWLYGEADGIPGLICDLYRLELESGSRWLAVVQSSTAGADRILSAFGEALKECSDLIEQGEVKLVGLLVARDSSARSLEGLSQFPREFHPLQDSSKTELIESQLRCGSIAVESASPNANKPALFDVDFIDGQKTGFFLDQRSNTAALVRIIQSRLQSGDLSQPIGPFTILDLFSYVGQWSVQVSRAVSACGAFTLCDLYDASEPALKLAAINVERAGGRARIFTRDVLRAWDEIPVTHYDAVICDPPALVKKKKDLAVGSAAYVKLFRESIRRVKENGLIVLSSCSGLVDEDAFQAIATEAVLKSGRSVAWIARGGHSADHPWRTEFLQGRYLKAQIGIVTEKL